MSVDAEQVGPYPDDAAEYPLAVRAGAWLGDLVDDSRPEWASIEEITPAIGPNPLESATRNGTTGEFTVHVGDRSLNVTVSENPDPTGPLVSATWTITLRTQDGSDLPVDYISEMNGQISRMLSPLNHDGLTVTRSVDRR